MKINIIKNISFYFVFSLLILTNEKSFSQNTELILKKADSLNKLNSFDKSLELYSKILKIDSKNSKAYNGKGNCYFKMEMTDSAVTNYEKAIKFDAKYFSPVYNLTNLYFSTNEYEKAKNIIDIGLKAFPDSSEIYYLTGYFYNVQQNSDSAIYFYNKSFEKDNSKYNGLYNIALIYSLSKNNNDSAIIFIDKLLQINPKDTSSLLLKARIFLNNEEYDKSENICLEAIKMLPNNYSFYEILAEIYLYTNEFDKAIINADKVLLYEETNYVSIYVKANSLLYLKNYEKSYNTSIKASEIYPEDYIFYYFSAMSVFYMKKYEQSITFFDIAIEKNPEIPTLYYNKVLAELYINSKQKLENDKFTEFNTDKISEIEKTLTSKKSIYNYESLLKKFENEPLKLGYDDFFALYFGKSLNKNYSGYSKSLLKYSFEQKYNSGDYDGCIKEALSAIENDYTYFGAYDYLMGAYFQKRDYANFYKYYYIYTGFMKGIFMTGNGDSDKSGLIITSVTDEYSFLSFFGLIFESQQLIQSKNHTFDVLIVDDKELFPKGVYFIIDSFFGKF
jgi:tetratricopeptide (TPR) repeat protein